MLRNSADSGINEPFYIFYSRTSGFVNREFLYFHFTDLAAIYLYSQ